MKIVKMMRHGVKNLSSSRTANGTLAIALAIAAGATFLGPRTTVLAGSSIFS